MSMETTNEKVVSKAVAIQLRKFGHNDWCDCYYHTDPGLESSGDLEMGNNQVCNSTFEDYHERVAAPYVSQCLLWLMVFKQVTLNVHSDYSECSGCDTLLAILDESEDTRIQSLMTLSLHIVQRFKPLFSEE